MDKLTSFTHFVTGEGARVSYTFSEIDAAGNLVSQNNKGNFIVLDEELLTYIAAIGDYITKEKLKQ